MASARSATAPPRRHRGAAARALQASSPALGRDAPSGDHLAEIGSYQHRHPTLKPPHRTPIAPRTQHPRHQRAHRSAPDARQTHIPARMSPSVRQLGDIPTSNGASNDPSNDPPSATPADPPDDTPAASAPSRADRTQLARASPASARPTRDPATETPLAATDSLERPPHARPRDPVRTPTSPAPTARRATSAEPSRRPHRQSRLHRRRTT